MRQLIVILILVGVCANTQAQSFTYSNTQNPVNVVNTVLTDGSVTITNISFRQGTTVHTTTVAPNLQTFTATGFPFSSGIFINTNDAGSSNMVDSDLSAITSASIRNGGILEFDFIATGEGLSFNYMFASSEYNSFTCSSYNDVFGFFLSGPGINGPFSNNAINLAVIPGTNTPVGINMVNSGSPSILYPASNCLAVNPNFVADAIYFTTQYGGYGGQGYNGGTVVLPATADLVCGETYHIKMGICNVSDQSYDSGVYLEAGSFTTLPMNVSFDAAIGDSVLYEGCEQTSQLIFSRAGCAVDSVSLEAWLQWGGTATRDVDYLGAVDTVILAPGVLADTLIINPLSDNIIEGMEDIQVAITMLDYLGDTVTINITMYIDDVPSIIVSAHDTTIFCLEHDVSVFGEISGGFPPYDYWWRTLDSVVIDSLLNTDTTNTTIEPEITENGVHKYVLTYKDVCGYERSDTANVFMNQTLHIDTMIVNQLATCQPVGKIEAGNAPFGLHAVDSSVTTGWTYDRTFKWTAEYDTTINFPNQNALNNVAGGWYYLKLTDNIIDCSVYDSIFLPVENVPVAIIKPNIQVGCAPLEVTFGNDSQNSNTYQWVFAEGDTVSTTSTSSFTRTFADSTQIHVVRLVASNGDAFCNDTSYVGIKPEYCPFPTVESPNVLNLKPNSPNNIYMLKVENASSIEMIILNRWGSVVYQESGTQSVPPRWNGRDKSGNDLPDGVYFVKYKIVGVMGEVLEGNDFVTIIR